MLEPQAQALLRLSQMSIMVLAYIMAASLGASEGVGRQAIVGNWNCGPYKIYRSNFYAKERDSYAANGEFTSEVSYSDSLELKAAPIGTIDFKGRWKLYRKYLTTEMSEGHYIYLRDEKALPSATAKLAGALKRNDYQEKEKILRVDNLLVTKSFKYGQIVSCSRI